MVTVVGNGMTVESDVERTVEVVVGVGIVGLSAANTISRSDARNMRESMVIESLY
jgi:predicted NAD/FAD-binding protein